MTESGAEGNSPVPEPGPTLAGDGPDPAPSPPTPLSGVLHAIGRAIGRALGGGRLRVAAEVATILALVVALIPLFNQGDEPDSTPPPQTPNGSQPSNSGAATTSGGPVATQSSQRTLIGEITDPSNNEQVPMIITASGRTMGAVPPSHQLWLFVEFLPNGFFSPGAITQRGNQWVANDLYAGGPGQAGQSFNLHLTDLGPAARERLDVYFEDERRELERGGNPRGFGRAELEELDVEFLDEVAVHRRP